MSANGQATTASDVLHWPGRVLAEEDVRTRLNGHREVVLAPRAIITPLAAEQLRARKIRIIREERRAESAERRAGWGYAQEMPNALVQSAVRALERDGILLDELQSAGSAVPCRWAKALAECIARGECQGGVVFCSDPGLVCCVSNKLAGLRAVAVANIAQTSRAALTLSANLIAVEMPGRTYFELVQILRILCSAASACPDGVACTLKELDGHAHR
jgi:hypothetical protein